ncbi:VOC family protein [Bacillus sp. JJ722]|uniref:VOC family protein n=1 Tax=Bacillus sp. JJ722 TaxID=3122973 RepID=UPI003000720F
MKIKKVQLLISNFEQTVSFYKDLLQFKLLSANTTNAIFQIGSSELELMKDQEQNDYYYHFAFNIHSNLFQKAKSWLAERVELLREDGVDEIDFDGRAQANACYFEDPAGNIVEYIARREISPTSTDQVFTSNNVLSISEMSLTTDDLNKVAQKFEDIKIPVRDHEELYYEEYLNFMGEHEDGCFILFGPVGRRWLFSEKLAIASPVTIYTDRGMISNL